MIIEEAGKWQGGVRFVMVEIGQKDFEELVLVALVTLPDEFRTALKNIDIVVEDFPPLDVLTRTGVANGFGLLGLYQGVPLKDRGPHYSGTLPDKISVFKVPLESSVDTIDELMPLVQHVVLHELGHYFGLSDDEMRESRGPLH
ncbi:MAG: metallopeptidase family protein [Candidatus Cryosericum sp.]|nr:metallopeptidase family protein [bacterium]